MTNFLIWLGHNFLAVSAVLLLAAIAIAVSKR